MNLSISRLVRRTVMFLVLCSLPIICTAQSTNVDLEVRALLEGALIKGVCARTAEVQQKLISDFGRSNCADVTEEDFAATRLDLSSRGISALAEDDFNGFFNLRELDLDDNNIGTSTLPLNIFSELSNLEILNLRANGITLSTLPINIFNGLSNLRTLNLHSNDLGRGLSKDIFNGLTNLQELNLGSNDLDILDSGVFSNLANLQILSLESSNLVSLQPDTFQGLNNLRTLNLSNNKLIGVEEVSLDGTSLTLMLLQFSTFRLPELRNLNLSGNPLGSSSGDSYCSQLGDSLEETRNGRTYTVTTTTVVADNASDNICEIEITIN